MKQELNTELFQKLQRARFLNKELDCWSARVLQQVLGYVDWRSFLKVLNKAKLICKDAGIPERNHFANASRRMKIGKGGSRKVDDMSLTRYAGYLIAQNADPARNETAFAQIYFSMQIRKLEVIEQRLLNIKDKLPGIIYEPGTDEEGFESIRSGGDKALFGDNSNREMKKERSILDDRFLVDDFLSNLPARVKDIAAEVTRHNVREKKLVDEYEISMEYLENYRALRNMLIERGIKPEAVPAAEDITKIARDLEALRRIRSKAIK